MIEEIAPSSDARIVLDSDGSIHDATKAALSMLGYSLEELRKLPPGALSTMAADDRAALRGQWEEAHPKAAIGRANVRGSDGRNVPVAFVLKQLHDGRWEAVLQRLDNSVKEPKFVFSIGAALAAWRAADRRLEELEAGSAERQEVERDVARLRAEYRRLFDAANRRD